MHNVLDYLKDLLINQSLPLILGLLGVLVAVFNKTVFGALAKVAEKVKSAFLKKLLEKTVLEFKEAIDAAEKAGLDAYGAAMEKAKEDGKVTGQELEEALKTAAETFWASLSIETVKALGDIFGATNITEAVIAWIKEKLNIQD
jgi:hypothetical protein